MKTLGKVVTWVAGAIAVVCVLLTTIASCQGRTIKDMFEKQEVQEEIVDDTVQDETAEDETIVPDTTAKFLYNAESNTICL